MKTSKHFPFLVPRYLVRNFASGIRYCIRYSVFGIWYCIRYSVLYSVFSSMSTALVGLLSICRNKFFKVDNFLPALVDKTT